MLDFLVKFPDLLHSAIVFGTVIMFGALGEIITEKSGNLNLGVPGIMYFGGIAGLTSTFMYENVYCANAGVEPNAALCVIMCLVASFLASALGGLIYSFLTISLRTNQNVTGLTLTILGSGVGNFFGGSLNKLAGGVGQVSVAVTSQAFRNYSLSLVNFFDGFTGKLRLGTLLFSYGFLTYVAIILAVAIWFFLSKTRTGLSLRAIGENTATADAAGINVTKYKYLATCIGAGISGLGGTYYVMNYIKGTWENQGTIEALGWLAVALVIFATWKSLRAIWRITTSPACPEARWSCSRCSPTWSRSLSCSWSPCAKRRRISRLSPSASRTSAKNGNRTSQHALRGFSQGVFSISDCFPWKSNVINLRPVHLFYAKKRQNKCSW